MDVDGLDLKPWQRQPGESPKAFHAFTHFLSLLPWERSMATAYTAHLTTCKGQNHTKKVHCIPDWQDWRFKFSWLERASAHDAVIAEHDRLRRVHEIEQMNYRHTQIAVALQNVVVEQLQEMAKTGEKVKLSPVAMARVLDRAALVERRSRGEATSIIKRVGDESEGAVALDLSKLTEEELEVFQHLVQKAEPNAAKVED